MIAPTSRPRARRILFWLASSILLIVTILACGFVYLRYTNDCDLQLALAETDQLDPNWRLEDLEAHRRPTPASGANGFDALVEAVNSGLAKPWPQLSFPQSDTDHKYRATVAWKMSIKLRTHDRLSPVILSDDEARALRPGLERGKVAIALLRKLVDYSYGRGPAAITDRGFAAVVPRGYLPMFDAGKVLTTDARVRIYDGDLVGALQDFHALLHMSLILEGEFNLMAQLARRALQSDALEILERTLAGGTLSEDDLVAAQKELERSTAAPGIQNGLWQTRAFLNRLLETGQKDDITKEELRNYVTTVPPAGAGSGFRQFLESIRFAFFYGHLASERARMLRMVNEQIRISGLPPHERIQALQARMGPSEQPSGFLATITEPYIQLQIFNRYLEDELGIEAAISCAIAAVAAERFRIANQRWPESTDELTPRYLTSAPIDLYSGQPLRLMHKDSLLIIYSVGPNKKDDGGKISSTAITNKNGLDIGFILQDPAQRPRPGAPFVYPKR